MTVVKNYIIVILNKGLESTPYTFIMFLKEKVNKENYRKCLCYRFINNVSLIRAAKWAILENIVRHLWLENKEKNLRDTWNKDSSSVAQACI